MKAKKIPFLELLAGFTSLLVFYLSSIEIHFCFQNTLFKKSCKKKKYFKNQQSQKSCFSISGTGISVVNKWSQIPKMRPLIVQKYVAKPHLINETKYDLRLYVLLTSLHPLRIYLYDEGLVRFASNPYRSDSKSLSDVFTHLTNYSINKNSSTYCPNEDSEVRQGHKWTLSSLWQHFTGNDFSINPQF